MRREERSPGGRCLDCGSDGKHHGGCPQGALAPKAAVGLTEFLTARIAEDEEVAGLATERIYVCDDGHVETLSEQWDDGSDRLPNHHNSWRLIYDPTRVLAECEAKRAILNACVGAGFRVQRDDVLHALAHSYADHPDWRKDW
jgi:hypothetical protein